MAISEVTGPIWLCPRVVNRERTINYAGWELARWMCTAKSTCEE